MIGVVARAEAASEAVHSGIENDPFPMRFGVRNYAPIDPPIAIDIDLCRELDFFRDRDMTTRTVPSLVQVTRAVSEHDFRLLTERADSETENEPAPPSPPSAPPQGSRKALGRRMSPATVFKYLERALQEGLGRREFGPADMKQVDEFFGEPLSCVYCGSSEWALWDHLVPAIAGGETVLGNLVPACQPCNDSKGSRAFDTWLATRPVSDREVRVELLREYQRQFGYIAGRAESRLSPGRLAEFEDLVRRAKALQSDIEKFLRSRTA